jgi:hypothetical protein
MFSPTPLLSDSSKADMRMKVNHTTAGTATAMAKNQVKLPKLALPGGSGGGKKVGAS